MTSLVPSPDFSESPAQKLDHARRTLQRVFGYPDFRPPQIRAVEAVLSGRDALVVLPTGGGKSLCYQVPALMRPGLTIVVSPLISLMKDQVQALERRGVGAAFINSTLSPTDVANRMAQARDGSLTMLYLAPERMEAGRTLQQLAQIGVALLAVDEAHCISEWGHDFRPSYRRIGAVRAQLGAPQTVALTATATPDVRRDIVRQLALRDAEVVVAGFDRTNLTYHVKPTWSPTEKDRVAIELLHQHHAPAVVYAPTRKAVERIAATLQRAKVSATAYHAGLTTTQRQRAQDAFMEERTRVIVATSAFGMGIDKPDVRLVVHHAMPGSLEAYYQEAGRAGRDGKPGTCVLLYDITDRFTHEFFIDNANPPRVVVEQVWEQLRKAATPDGFAPLSDRDLARLLPVTVGERLAGAALRVLAASGACRLERASRHRVGIRLVATPERIRSELTGERAREREVLRTLWREVGRRLESGVVVQLDTLSPQLGPVASLVPLLERLEAEQFLVLQKHGAGVRLHARVRNAKSPPVDWEHLARRRQIDGERLDAMEEYAQTRYCRRAYVLRYFGDPGARSHCGACDRCLGPTGTSAKGSRPRALPSRSRQRS